MGVSGCWCSRSANPASWHCCCQWLCRPWQPALRIPAGEGAVAAQLPRSEAHPWIGHGFRLCRDQGAHWFVFGLIGGFGSGFHRQTRAHFDRGVSQPTASVPLIAAIGSL